MQEGTAGMNTCLSLTTHHLHLLAATRISSLRMDNCDLGQCDEEALAALVTRLVALDMEDVRWARRPGG